MGVTEAGVFEDFVKKILEEKKIREARDLIEKKRKDGLIEDYSPDLDCSNGAVITGSRIGYPGKENPVETSTCEKCKDAIGLSIYMFNIRRRLITEDLKYVTMCHECAVLNASENGRIVNAGTKIHDIS